MIKAIITDIEGTTTSLAFVHQTLFPYARARIREFLREQAGNDEVQKQLAEVERLEHRELSLQEAAEVLERWMDEDRKVTVLKVLQGMVWKIGYDSGELRGHVYPDAAEHLRRWHAAGIRL